MNELLVAMKLLLFMDFTLLTFFLLYDEIVLRLLVRLLEGDPFPFFSYFYYSSDSSSGELTKTYLLSFSCFSSEAYPNKNFSPSSLQNNRFF